MGKRLFLHIGTQKTGSSYLQYLLRENAVALSGRGISYRNYADELISSGNGDILIRAIHAEMPLADFRLALDEYFAGAHTAIISSELLYSVDMNWRYLFKTFGQCDTRTELLVFFRSPVEYLTSAYSQVVRRESYTKSLHEFIRERPVSLYDAPLRNIVAAVEAEAYDLRMHLFSYSQARTRLWETMLDAFSIEDVGLKKEDVVINASLSAEEIELQRIYNCLFPEDQTGRFADFLQEEKMFGEPTPIHITKQDFDLVKESYRDTMEFVNEFVTGPEIEILSTKVSPDAAPSALLDLTGVEAILGFLYSEKVRLLTLMPDFRRMVAVARADVPEREMVLAETPDFDPLEYLMINPEVAQAGANPYRHYLKFGRDEGRNYRVDDEQGSPNDAAEVKSE